jgi:hypothetical protein
MKSTVFSVILVGLSFIDASDVCARQTFTAPGSVSVLQEAEQFKPSQAPKIESSGQGDARAEIAALRAEVAKLRLDLDAALKAIKRLGGDGPAQKGQGLLYRGKPARAWLEQFRDADPKFRAEAVTALGVLGETNKELIPVLVTALKDKHDAVGAKASKALGSLGPDVVPVLMEVLTDKTSTAAVRRAADTMHRIGPGAKAAVPLLAKALKTDDWSVRLSCVRALGSVGPDAKSAIPEIVEVLGIYRASLELAAKREKTAEFDRVGETFLPSNLVHAVGTIDAEVWDVLPSGRVWMHGVNPSYYLPEIQQIHDALKKRYLKDK